MLFLFLELRLRRRRQYADLEEFILPDTFEELMGEQPQQHPVQAKGSAPGISVQNLYTGRGEKKIDNLNMTELTIAPTETHLRPIAKVCPIQTRILTMNQRLERQKFSEEKQEADNSEGTPISTGAYGTESYPKEIYIKCNHITRR